MILIDALYINEGGGKTLLDYFIKYLENNQIEVFYLLDERIKNKIENVKLKNKVVFLKASLRLRNTFYRKNINKFSKVFCLGNLPPTIKLKIPVYTYFHHPLLLQYTEEMPLLKRPVYYLKKKVLNSIKNNTDFWIVQTDFIKEKFSKKYLLDSHKILKIPFYEPFNILSHKTERIKGQYVFVSLGIPYKNHKRLINAFCKFYDEYKYGNLILTLSENFKELINIIKYKQKQGYPINNVGFLNRKEIQQLFLQSEYHIFPSLTESLGLGIIESIDCGCKVIGSNLPYMHAACEPSIVFNPMNQDAIVAALKTSMKEDVKPSVSKIENMIEEIIALLV